MPIPLAAGEVLAREFLPLRSRLIESAAVLDRIDRAEGGVGDDPRLEKVRQSLRVLADDASDRAEQLQMLFSLPYRDGWRAEYDL